MTTGQFLGYLAPSIAALLIAAASWLKGHAAQKTAGDAQTTAENANAKADRALNGLADHPPGP